MRVVLGDALNEFGFNHERGGPGSVAYHFRENTLNCQDAKSNLGGAKMRDK
jgi:hypothetical protein